MDKEWFTNEILQMEASLYCVARTYFPSIHDCADAVQEAILLAWKNRHTLKNIAYFKTWLIRILINQCKNMLKQRIRVIPVQDVPEPPPDTTDPWLYESVMLLDQKYRLPFVLYHVEGYATKEIAQIMSIPKGTVVSRLHRARQQLKETWAGQEVCQYGK